MCVWGVSGYEKIIISRGAEAAAQSKAANGDTEECTHTVGHAQTHTLTQICALQEGHRQTHKHSRPYDLISPTVAAAVN